MIDEHLELPFDTEVLGVGVKVTKIDLTVEPEIVAVLRRGWHKQTISILDLRLQDPRPRGAEWIEAYRRLKRSRGRSAFRPRSNAPGRAGGQIQPRLWQISELPAGSPAENGDHLVTRIPLPCNPESRD